MDQPRTAEVPEISPGTPLAGHHALVTGAGRGIGAAVAEALARRGADLTLIGRTIEPLEARAYSLRDGFGVRVVTASADVTDAAAVDGAFALARERIGAPDILINNAGAAKSAPLARTDAALWNEMLGVNLTGVYICSRAALDGMNKDSMTQDGFGRIVNVASIAGLEGYAYVSAYCAAKHGVIGLTRALALETAGTGVTVNAVCPGYTDTDMTRQSVENIAARTGRSREEALASLTAANPGGRLITPEEVAETVVWLCLPASAAITGQAIAVA